MKFICIMGRSNSGKTSVEHYLEKMGFKRSISYTTRKPEIRDGVHEQDGVEYKFVTEEKFMELVDKGKIIEYERYGNNLYGTPLPYGSTRYVSVVCINGFRALKKLYGDQVLGVYIQCDKNIALDRAQKRDTDTEKVKSRYIEDDKLIKEMEDEADIIIDGNQDLNKMLCDVLKSLRETEK